MGQNLEHGDRVVARMAMGDAWVYIGKRGGKGDIPMGAVGVVTAVISEGKRYQVLFEWLDVPGTMWCEEVIYDPNGVFLRKLP